MHGPPPPPNERAEASVDASMIVAVAVPVPTVAVVDVAFPMLVLTTFVATAACGRRPLVLAAFVAAAVWSCTRLLGLFFFLMARWHRHLPGSHTAGHPGLILVVPIHISKDGIRLQCEKTCVQHSFERHF
mmetsp:Transcript_56721/g.120667  ORF Transcript_56721/g.120667 Transcript_56721/m.120667 type:complete len:130 (+) Transcript_56721:512-901(+)